MKLTIDASDLQMAISLVMPGVPTSFREAAALLIDTEIGVLAASRPGLSYIEAPLAMENVTEHGRVFVAATPFQRLANISAGPVEVRATKTQVKIGPNHVPRVDEVADVFASRPSWVGHGGTRVNVSALRSVLPLADPIQDAVQMVSDESGVWISTYDVVGGCCSTSRLPPTEEHFDLVVQASTMMSLVRGSSAVRICVGDGRLQLIGNERIEINTLALSLPRLFVALYDKPHDGPRYTVDGDVLKKAIKDVEFFAAQYSRIRVVFLSGSREGLSIEAASENGRVVRDVPAEADGNEEERWGTCVNLSYLLNSVRGGEGEEVIVEPARREMKSGDTAVLLRIINGVTRHHVSGMFSSVWPAFWRTKEETR